MPSLTVSQCPSWLLKSQGSPLLAAEYLADLERVLEAAPEEEGSIDVLAGYMDCKFDVNLSDSAGGTTSVVQPVFVGAITAAITLYVRRPTWIVNPFLRSELTF